jgi:DNA-binding transcriptional LysR family regulator
MEVADDLFCRAPCGRRYIVLRHRRLERCQAAPTIGTVGRIQDESVESYKLVSGLRDGKLDLAIIIQLKGAQTAGIEFELLRTYPLCVALAATHPFTRLKSVPLEKVAAEPLIGLCRREYPEFHRNLNRIFAPVGVKPRFAVECDTTSSGLIEVEAGHGIALSIPILELVTGKRLVYRLVTGTTELMSIGIARAAKGALTSAGERFCEILRNISAACAMPERV